jgi:small-conductance mechanosensitive channel
MTPALIISPDNIEAFIGSKSRRTPFPQHVKNLGLAICILLMQATAFAQHDTAQLKHAYDSVINNGDTAISGALASFKQFGFDEQRKNLIEYSEDTIATKQDEIIEKIRNTTLDAKNYLRNALDTTGLGTELNKIEDWYNVTGDGVFINTGSIQTNRNLETSADILKELLARTLTRKSSLDNYYKDLVSFRNKIDSFNRAGVLYKFSSDSAALIRYVKKLIVLAEEVRPVDSAFKKTLTNVSELQTAVNGFVNDLNSSIEQIEIFRKELSGRAFSREVANLGGPTGSSRPFSEIIDFSQIKGALAFVFFIRNNLGRIILIFILVLTVTIFLANLKRNLRSQDLLTKDLRGQIVLKYPVLSAFVIVLSLFQFIFFDPPFIFNALVWTISAIFLTIIFRKFIARYWMLAWYTMLILFLFVCADNLILQASRAERWIMLALSIAGIFSGSIISMTGRKRVQREKWIIYFIDFFVLMQLAALFANIYGRYNLSKNCLTGGFFSVVIAILFLWTVRFINEGLFLATAAYRFPGKKIFYINFERVGSKAPAIFYVLLIIGWFILFARNFYASRLISEPISDFIFQERTIGKFSFTIGNMLEFFLILFLAGMTSRIVSFFASDRYYDQHSQAQKGGIGSWLLLIRISIISVGLFLAFAAAGIPMDRVTIILSALSVGIGFGLQTLVNNLVSGLIISFEKPVNVGDIVDIGGQSGTIKSIGFRSSVLSTWEGSDVVIPNGDLLNQHLVNWTLSNASRRVDILVGVAYGTNLEKAAQILKELPAKDKRILAIPGPSVIIQTFNNSSIDIKLFFWVGDINVWTNVKSDLILAIDTAFKENGIEIPFPQQDIYIHSVAKEDNNKIEIGSKD